MKKSDVQADFRKGHGTREIIAYMLGNWENQKQGNLCFIGYRKVFDSAVMSSYEMSLRQQESQGIPIGLTMNNKQTSSQEILHRPAVGSNSRPWKRYSDAARYLYSQRLELYKQWFFLWCSMDEKVRLG